MEFQQSFTTSTLPLKSPLSAKNSKPKITVTRTLTGTQTQFTPDRPSDAVPVNSLTDTYGGTIATDHDDESQMYFLSSKNNPFDNHKHTSSRTSKHNNSLGAIQRVNKHNGNNNSNNNKTQSGGDQVRPVVMAEHGRLVNTASNDSNNSSKDDFKHKNNNRKSNNNNNNHNNHNNMAVDVSPLTDTASPIKLGHKHHHNNNRLNLDRLKLNIPTQKELESIYLSNYYNQTQIEFTFRSVLIGLSIGWLLCWYNIFFGLKNGNIVLGSIQSSLLGFGILKLCEKFGSYSSSRLELNIIQTIAVASSHMPIAAGFVGLIPALSKLNDKNDIDADPVTLSMEELFIWTLSLSLFGLFIVVPLRNEFIVNQNLTFPSGTATAKMIELFYSKHLVSQIETEMQMEKAKKKYAHKAEFGQFRAMLNQTYTDGNVSGNNTGRASNMANNTDLQFNLKAYNNQILHEDTTTNYSRTDNYFSNQFQLQQGHFYNPQNTFHSTTGLMSSNLPSMTGNESGATKYRLMSDSAENAHLNYVSLEPNGDDSPFKLEWKMFRIAFGVSSFFKFLGYFLPVFQYIPIFGMPLRENYLISFNLNFSYIGQGMIAGIRVGLSLLAGSFVGWGFIGPLLVYRDWATKDNSSDDDWITHESTWMLFIGISIIIGEVIVTLIITLFDLLGDSCWRKINTNSNDNDNINGDRNVNSGNYSSQNGGSGGDPAAMLGFILGGQSHGNSLNSFRNHNQSLPTMTTTMTTNKSIKYDSDIDTEMTPIDKQLGHGVGGSRMDIHKKTSDLELNMIDNKENDASYKYSLTPPQLQIPEPTPTQQPSHASLQLLESNTRNNSQYFNHHTNNNTRTVNSARYHQSEIDMQKVRNQYAEWMDEYLKENNKSIHDLGDTTEAYQAFLDLFFNEQQRKYYHAHSYVPFGLWMPGLMFSTLICIVSLNYISKLQLTWYEVFFSLAFAVIISLISTRAYGQTDMNPVSKLGKLSQLLFYGLDDIAQGRNADSNITGNLFGGGVAESVAGQDGSLLQTFKTGYLLMASAKLQFYGQIIGTVFSVIFTVCGYKLFMSAYSITNNDAFTLPFVTFWINIARALSDGKLPPEMLPMCGFGFVIGVLFGMLTQIKSNRISVNTKNYMPIGVAFAIGMFIKPNKILPRSCGSIAHWIWRRKNRRTNNKYMIVVASGFMLGEGMFAILNAVLSAFDVPCCFVN